MLTDIAPEVDVDELRDAIPIRQQTDLDSLEWIRFLIEVYDRLHIIDTPEFDYAALRTLTDVVQHVNQYSAAR
ncbi:hypothetical protein BH09ACT7_BH09ACT7_38870 [soil metagenome]